MRRCVALGALVATALVQTVRADDKNTNINQRKANKDWMSNQACSDIVLNATSFCHEATTDKWGYLITGPAARNQDQLDADARYNWESNMEGRMSISKDGRPVIVPPKNCSESYAQFACQRNFMQCEGFRSSLWYFWQDSSRRYPVCQSDCLKTRTFCTPVSVSNHTGSARQVPMAATCHDLPDDCCIGKVHSGCVENKFPLIIVVLILVLVFLFYGIYKSRGGEADLGSESERAALKETEIEQA